MALFNSEKIRELEKVFDFLYSNDEERLAVIQCDETKDIVACPGSGKTTCLAAKLYLLAKRLPLKNGSGVCVIAHTNNTIDEIKKKLGNKAEVYTSYPNFIGTIQSFVDRYLAILSSIKYFRIRPVAIENDSYYSEIEYQRRFLGRRVAAWCMQSGNLGFPGSVRYKWSSFDEEGYKICKGIDETEINFNRNTKLNNPPSPKEIEYKLKRMKEYISKKGILCYDDAYSYAARYLHDYGYKLVPALSQRFKYVFIDEMQDTAKHQLHIIEECFDDSVVIQRFGDPNQAIYSYIGALKADNDWIIRNNDSLTIASSKRFKEPIANVVNRLCLNSYENPMRGEGDCVEEYPPVIITFNDDNRKKTLEAFVKIIKENNLEQIDAKVKKPFRAIGWVGKKRYDDKLVIGSYCVNFIQHEIKQKKEFDCLNGYIKACEYIDQNKKCLKDFKDIIFRCLAKALRKDECKFNDKYLAATKLEKKLYEDHKSSLTQLRKKIIEWFDDLRNKRSIKDELEDYIKNDFSNLFDNFDPNHIQGFLTEEYEGEFEYTEDRSHENKVIYDGVEIEISTIHSAKGQTHEATLYLETFYKKNDIEDIIEFLKGNSPTSNDTQKCRLKMAYVGMSRPRSLLCVAAREESIAAHADDLIKAGWEIKSVNEILK